MTENLPKITVITATFNLINDGREAYFRQCVESVHNQTYPNIEHIVMDGASTDGSLDLIREYEEKEWLKCYSEPDNGMEDGMNKGLKKATGKYIVILNSDDYYHTNDIIEKCIKKLEETGADYLYGNLNVITLKGELIYLPVLSREFFFKQMPINHETLIVKKDIYQKLGWYDTSYKTTIDYAFLCKLILNDCSFVFLNDAILTVRLGGGTTAEDGSVRDHVIKTVTLLYKDLFGSFYPLTDKDCYDMFVNHNFKDSFLLSLRNYLVKKNLKNFNYTFFFKIIDEIITENKKQLEIIVESIKGIKKQLETNQDTRLTTKKVYVFGIHLFSYVISQNKEVCKLFGFLPIMKKKIKENKE